MERGIGWTTEVDARLLSLRAMGLTWGLIGRELQLGRTAVRERGRRLGAVHVPRARVQALPGLEERPPLPPGHPASWGLLTAGTVLAGEAYPFPVFA